jgi:hypothetical protein
MAAMGQGCVSNLPISALIEVKAPRQFNNRRLFWTL